MDSDSKLGRRGALPGAKVKVKLSHAERFLGRTLVLLYGCLPASVIAIA